MFCLVKVLLQIGPIRYLSCLIWSLQKQFFPEYCSSNELKASLKGDPQSPSATEAVLPSDKLPNALVWCSRSAQIKSQKLSLMLLYQIHEYVWFQYSCHHSNSDQRPNSWKHWGRWVRTELHPPSSLIIMEKLGESNEVINSTQITTKNGDCDDDSLIFTE